MATRSKSDLHTTLAQRYDLACGRYKYKYPNDPQPFITCAYRTKEEQDALFEQGVKDPKKKVTNARGGESPHNYLPSFAFDIAFINPLTQKLDWNKKYFLQFAECVKEFGESVEWGGDWKFTDLPHFQLRDWKNLKN